MANEQGKGYGKRPLWQWILIYLVVGAVVYWGIYYFYIGRKAGSNGGNPTTQHSPY